MDMLQLPEVHSVLASAGQAGAMIAEVASLRETTAGDQDVILPPKLIRHLLHTCYIFWRNLSSS